MKRFLSLLVIFAAVAVAKPVHAQQKAKWQELDAFHEVMSKTFHPAEEGKLEPIRSRSAEMLEKAIAWKNSTAPEGYDQKAVKENLKDLVKGAKEINKMVQDKADDASLKEKLSKLHDSFHQIVEKCEKEEHH
ncbi:MAG TPA: hypothetical protein VKB95_05705 [Chitinophagaceae bacterium]|nr:hypothetical protein [Chitinophagaceae bacterium]